MPIILPVLQDPTDKVIPGEQIIPPFAPPIYAPIAMLPIMEGETQLEDLTGFPMPQAMIGRNDWDGVLPRKIGPMVINGNTVEMLDIGAPLFKSPNIDPIQTWINSPFPIDMTGMWFDLTPDMLGAFEATNAMVWPISEPIGTPVVVIPRGAVYRSGLVKINTASILSPTFGQHIMKVYTPSTLMFRVSGVTLDSSGSPLGGCKVVLMVASMVTKFTDINPVIDEQISDGSGNYSFQVSSGGPYQLTAYLAGSPDVAGITVNNITTD